MNRFSGDKDVLTLINRVAGRCNLFKNLLRVLEIYLGCFLLLIYYLFTKNNNYWQSKGIPYDKPTFIFGSMSTVFFGKEHISQAFRRIYRQYNNSPYVGIFLFNRPTLMVRSPEFIKRILVKDFDKFTNRNAAINEKRDPITFHNLAVSRDTTWKNQRMKISPVFTSGKMKLMFPLMTECAKDLQVYLEKRVGNTVEMKNVVKRYSVDIISSCAFGVKANCLQIENADIFEVARKLLDPKSLVRNLSLFCFFFAPKLMDLFRLTFVDYQSANYLVEVFKNTLKEREKLKIVRNDLIDCLNQLKEKETVNDSYKFDDLKMAAQAILFFAAGNDTTTTTLTFAIYETARNKDIQERLREEIRKTVEENGGLTYESILKMKYLDMVLNETLRKYPIASFLNREAKTSYTFDSGVTIEKGTTVYIPLSGLHYDPEYFPNPEKFDPERFDPEKNNILPYTYMPFGDGPRMCIGQRFAQLSTKVALAHIFQNFAFELAKDTKEPLELSRSFFLQAKNGVHVKVAKV